jgi:adenine-specific DNA-methyltransferase
MDKMRMESDDIQQDNVAKVAALFPNCVTETRDENGHLRKLSILSCSSRCFLILL